MGREDVRRKRMALNIAMNHLRDTGAEADLRILLNMKEHKNDGDLLFLMGRCCEDGQNDQNAVDCYRKAIGNNAQKRIEAYQQLATLLRSQLDQPKEADQTIEEMVNSAPDNYLVYLARGRYRRQFGLPGSEADFRRPWSLLKARQRFIWRWPEPRKTSRDMRRREQIFEVGLKKRPVSRRSTRP